MAATQFATGKILYDKEGKIRTLKNEANKWLKRKFKNPNKIMIELQKYALWDNLDNLQDIYKKNSRSFRYAYYSSLNQIITVYSKYLRFTINQPYKTHEFLVDHETQKKYLQTQFPDQNFMKLFIKAIDETDKSKMLLYLERLTNYVFSKMGGFEINGWKIKSPTIVK